MLLIMGLGAQLIAWEEDLCRRLAARGFQVVRFDNRDVGLSSKMDEATVDLRELLDAAASGQQPHASYLVDDMAEDALAVIDAVTDGAVHVVGASMGGMIAQALAIRHPERTLSLASIMSTTGGRDVGLPEPEVIAALVQPAPQDASGAADMAMAVAKIIGSPAYPADEGDVRAGAVAAFERSNCPEGFKRQLAAIMASPDRTEALGHISTPTLVIHGEADRLVPPSGGVATAQAVPGARLVLIPGMGHDLPRALWGQIIDAIVANASRALNER